MRYGLCVLFIVLGAIMAWGINDTSPDGFDLNQIGLILFLIGLVGLVVALLVSAAPGDGRWRDRF
jgi:hypothetical protein